MDIRQFHIRKLGKEEKIPYDILLLADELIEAIDVYVHDSDIYVLESAEDMLAACVLQELPDNKVEIKNIAVREEFQGQGIGQFLLREITDRAGKDGYAEILIGTGDVSFKQLYIYQKAGFEVSEIKKQFFLENYPDPIFENGLQLKHMILLRKELK